MNPFIKRISLALILAGSTSSGLAWSWGSLTESGNPAQTTPVTTQSVDQPNPFVGKIFIKPNFERWFFLMKFTSDTGAVYVNNYHLYNFVVSYSADTNNHSLKFDGRDYKYTISGKVLRLDTIDSSEEWYEIPLPPFYNSSEYNSTNAETVINNIINQAKGGLQSSSTPSPTPANSPVTYNTAPTATPTPDQAPASLTLSYAIATTTTAVSLATPTPAKSPVTETTSQSTGLFHAERQLNAAPQSTSPNGIDSSVSAAPSRVTPDTTSLPAGTAQNAAPQNIETENTAAEAIQKMTNFGKISSTPNHDAKRNDEMFPQTRLRALDATEISMMNGPKLQCAINEMFARYGFVFQNQSIQKLFEDFSWYQPNPNRTQKDILSQFSQLEINNLNLLLNAQKSLSSKIEMSSTTLVAKSKAQSKVNVKVYSAHDTFPPDIIGKGVAGSFVLIQEAIGGGAMIVPAEDAMFPLAGRKFIVQNKTSGFPRGTAIPIQKQLRLNYSPANPLIITGKGPLPGFYTVKAP